MQRSAALQPPGTTVCLGVCDEEYVRQPHEAAKSVLSMWPTRWIVCEPRQMPGGTEEALRVIALVRDSIEFQSLLGIELTLSYLYMSSQFSVFH